MRVAYFGTWERGYPRNEHVISCLRGAGVEVDEIHVPVWHSQHKFALGPATLPRLGFAEARLAAPSREEAEEGAEGTMTYSSERGTESAGDRGDERRRRRPRRRRARPEAIAAHLKGTEGAEGTEGEAPESAE